MQWSEEGEEGEQGPGVEMLQSEAAVAHQHRQMHLLKPVGVVSVAETGVLNWPQHLPPRLNHPRL